MKYHITYFAFLPLFFLLVGCGSSNSTETASTEPGPETTSEVNQTEEPIDRSTSQQDKDMVNEEEEAAIGPIATIRKNYQRIQQALEAGNLRKDSIAFECENEPGGGKLIRYYDGDELVLMEQDEGGEHYWEKKRIYFEEDKPFFVYEEDGVWSFGGPHDEGQSNTIDKIKEHRYYIKDGELIQQLFKQFEIKSWEESATSDQVPNQKVEVVPGASYPGAAAIPQMRQGNVGC